MADAGAGGDDAEVVEGLLAPFQEHVAFHVPFVFAVHVGLEGAGGAEFVDHHRMVDDESTGTSGLILAAGFAVAATRRAEHIHEDNPRTQKLKRAGLIAGATAVGMAFGMALVGVPQIGQQQFNFDQLRFVIFALTLLVLMLLRPQGMFGHREITLSRFFKKDDAMGVKV